MADTELCRLLTAVVLLLVAAHLCGRLFARLRQPPVVGEILGGLLLGPTVLGVLAPGVGHWLFPATGPAAAALGVWYQLGLLLLMFLTGTQLRTVFSRESSRTVALVSITGLAVPFALGLGLARGLGTGRLAGPNGDPLVLTLIIAVAVAITSIPVISRIMLDLGILRTRFARVVLSVAVVEDVILNVVIAMALGLADRGRPGGFGLVSVLGIDSLAASIAYHALAPLAFLAAAALYTRRRSRRVAGSGRPAFSPVASWFALVLAMSAACLFLGVTPIFGAFVAGLLSGRSAGGAESAHLDSIRTFAMGCLVPVYFAIVGLKLDLVHHLDVPLTVGFIAFACVVKASSVYLGARLAGNAPLPSVNLAMAINARGGPGIVLATLAYDAGIVNDTFFTTLVLTALVTSLLAGSWLAAAVARRWLPVDEEVPRGHPAPRP